MHFVTMSDMNNHFLAIFTKKSHFLKLLFGAFFCSIQEARKEKRSCAEGKVVILCDSCVHHVWNRSSAPRSVLFVDIWKKGVGEESLHSA